MIDAEGGKAIKGDRSNKIQKGGFQRFKTAMMIKMFGVNIGDHGNGWFQLGKRSVAFIGFDHHPASFAKTSIAAPSGDDAAIDNGRVNLGTV